MTLSNTKTWSTYGMAAVGNVSGSPFTTSTKALLSTGMLYSYPYSSFAFVSRNSKREKRDKLEKKPYTEILKNHDLGNPFRLVRTQFTNLSHENVSTNTIIGGSPANVTGTFTPSDPAYIALQIRRNLGITKFDDAFDEGLGGQYQKLITFGSSAIAENRPFESVSEVTTALLELFPIARLGRMNVEVPKIPLKEIAELMLRAPGKHQVREYISRAGGEYLNIMFGWNPTIRDLEDLFYAVKESKRLLDNFAKRYEKQYRFRTKPEETRSSFSFTTSSDLPSTPPINSFFWSNLGTGKVSISGNLTQTRWASGAWLFHKYTDGGLSDQLNEWVNIVDYLYGLKPSLDTAWELTPFSWLVDWKTNIGHVLTNISNIGADGLALQFGYAMSHYEITADVSIPTVRLAGRPDLGPLRAKFEYSSKSRIRATPYGFGITPDSFTSKQWSILSALGLSFADKIPARR